MAADAESRGVAVLLDLLLPLELGRRSMLMS